MSTRTALGWWIVFIGMWGTVVSCNAPTPTLAPTVSPPRRLTTATETRIRPSATPVPSPSATATQSVSPTPAGTATPLNAAILTRLAQTPSPVVLREAQPNATGLVPGQTTEAQALAALGEPREQSKFKGMDYWFYILPTQPTLSALYFSNGVLQELDFRPKDLTVERVVAQFGPPDLVFFYPIPDRRGPVPVTLAPPGPPWGFLVYASSGLEFDFFCRDVKEYCPGVRRAYDVRFQTYFVPMSISGWLKRLNKQEGDFYLRPWTGFVD